MRDKYNVMFVTVRGSRTIKTVQLTENEVRNLCLKSSEIFLSQPILLELEAPLKICGKYVTPSSCVAFFVLVLHCTSLSTCEICTIHVL